MIHRWSGKVRMKFVYRALTVEPKLNSIKVRVFFRKNIEKKHLCRHEKNCYYFWKSNISVINLIVDSRNMIKVSKNMRLQKIRSTARVVFTKYQQFLSIFVVFLNGAEFWIVQWINRKWNIMQNYVVIKFLWTFSY